MRRLQLRKAARVPIFQRCAHGLRGCTHDRHAKSHEREPSPSAHVDRARLARILLARPCGPRLSGAGAGSACAFRAAVSATGCEPAAAPATPGFRCLGARTSSACGAPVRGADAASGAPNAAGDSGGAAQPAHRQLTLRILPVEDFTHGRGARGLRPASSRLTAPRRPWPAQRRTGRRLGQQDGAGSLRAWHSIHQPVLLKKRRDAAILFARGRGA